MTGSTEHLIDRGWEGPRSPKTEQLQHQQLLEMVPGPSQHSGICGATGWHQGPLGHWVPSLLLASNGEDPDEPREAYIGLGESQGGGQSLPGWVVWSLRSRHPSLSHLGFLTIAGSPNVAPAQVPIL